MIREKINDVTYKVQGTRDVTQILHFDLLKPYCGAEIPVWAEQLRQRTAADNRIPPQDGAGK